MNKIARLEKLIKSLCVYEVNDDEVIISLKNLLLNVNNENVISYWSSFFKTLCKYASADNLKGYISDLILTNDNIFTRYASCEKADELSENIVKAVKNDLNILETISEIAPNDIISEISDDDVKNILLSMAFWNTGESKAPLKEDWSNNLETIKYYHKTNGYGIYAKYRAFAWRNEKLCPVTSSNPITLDNLKSYEKQRKKVVDNTESFVMGLPANNALLYGDRGTGKSSTVHAVLNHFAPMGLRMIEVPKSAICEIPILLEKIVNSPIKFIIFIDDLSFNSDDDNYAQLKAVLEGSVSATQRNTLIYATSNRRHLIKESFSSRETDDLHRGDTMQETLSLSDRFGLSVTFINPDKNKYFEILDKIAQDRKLDVDFEKLHRGAERFALERGGRSPRVGRQYIDFVESKVKKGQDWN